MVSVSYTPGCPPAGGGCPNPFARVRINHILVGGSLITWELQSDFADPLPYQFTLQAGRTAHLDADDWTNVGATVEDASYLVDDERRLFGASFWTHYRIVLQTAADATYYSNPEPVLGNLSRHAWNINRELFRKHRLDFKLAANRGYLLKRKDYGAPCDCLDFQTEEPTNPDHLRCYGTGIVGGYQDPLYCIYAKTNPSTYANRVVDGRSNVEDVVSEGVQMLAEPQLASEDIWIDQSTDERYAIDLVKEIESPWGRGIYVGVTMRLLKTTHILYQYPIADQAVLVMEP